MSKGSIKKIIQANKKSLFNCVIFMLIFASLYVGYRVIWQWDTMTGWGWASFIILASLNLYIYSALNKFAKITKDGDEIISAGLPLDSPGLVEYHWDALYLTWATQVVTMFTNWGWLILGLIPAYALYQLVVNFLIPIYFSGGEGGDVDDEKEQRRRERAERRRTKVLRR